MRNYGDFKATCNTHDNYMHVTGYSVPLKYFFAIMKSDFFQKRTRILEKKELSEIHQKVPFFVFCGKLWQNSMPVCYFNIQN